jgi:transcriptional regulator with XRE-family HTH domain
MQDKKPMLPLPVKRALEKLGADISDARRRRRIPMALMGERAGIGRMTLVRIEQGDPAVSMGGYARVLFVLGLTTRLNELADAIHDTTGLALEEEHLPKRIHTRGKREPRSEK